MILEPVKGSCGQHLSKCWCMADKGHKGPHECVCGGCWNDDGEPVSLPHAEINPSFPFLAELREQLDKLFGAEPQD